MQDFLEELDIWESFRGIDLDKVTRVLAISIGIVMLAFAAWALYIGISRIRNRKLDRNGN